MHTLKLLPAPWNWSVSFFFSKYIFSAIIQTLYLGDSEWAFWRRYLPYLFWFDGVGWGNGLAHPYMIVYPFKQA